MFSGTQLTAATLVGNTLTAATEDAFTGMLSGIQPDGPGYAASWGTDLSNRSCFTSQKEYDSFGTTALSARYDLEWPR